MQGERRRKAIAKRKRNKGEGEKRIKGTKNTLRENRDQVEEGKGSWRGKGIEG